ncbi:DUF4136 domain-containing protein [Flexithrix dorotheae]|uniref:DUF4136 domain-containing protein n=1 Tax=Flexithrix dorotheae TaxID=70993 RepID=UPI0003720827|nr:DUF4136 domain-containing protein [Flexithrix dorotheae]
MKYNLLILLIAIAFMGCTSSAKIVTNHEEDVDFDQFKTFVFYPWDKDVYKMLARVDKERLRAAVKEEMEARGYKYLEDKDADLTVSLFVVFEPKKSTTKYTDYYGPNGPYGGYWGGGVWGGYVGVGVGVGVSTYGYSSWGWGGGHSSTQYTEKEYIMGTLVLDVFETEKRKLIFQGVTSGVIEENMAKRAKNIPKVMSRIYTQYPKKKIKK